MNACPQSISHQKDIELLIGTNMPKALEPLQVICSVDDGPYTFKTRSGWTVNGPLGGDSSHEVDGSQPELMVNRISVLNLDELWQQQFKADSPDRSNMNNQNYQRGDHKFMELFPDSLSLLMVITRLVTPLRKELNMPNNMLSRGCAEKVPPGIQERSDGKVCLIPPSPWCLSPQERLNPCCV